MPVIKKENIKLEPVASDKVKGATKANVIGPNDGWTDHTMRLFPAARSVDVTVSSFRSYSIPEPGHPPS